MKTTKKILISSILTILFCASIIVGSTYALFTSESTTNIAITSGKVDVKAEVVKDSLNLYSGVFNEETNTYEYEKQDGKFINGGTANFSDLEELELKEIAPLDKVEFEISLTNRSTIAIRYQVQLVVSGMDDLFEALVVSVDGVSLVNSGKTSVSKWSDLVEAGKEINNLKVTLELPEGVGNEYQGKTSSIAVTVYAVQGNAHVEDPVEKDQSDDTKLYIYNEQDLKDFRDKVNSGDDFKNKTVYLMNDMNLASEENWEPIGKDNTHPFNGGFDGQWFTVYNLTVNRTSEELAGFFGRASVGAHATFKNVRFDSVELTSKAYAGTLVANAYTSTIEGVEVKNAKINTSHWLGGVVGSVYGSVSNCKVTGLIAICTPDLQTNGSYDNGDKVGGIVGQVQDSGNYVIKNCTVEDSSLTAYRDLGGLVGCGTSPDKTYISNTVRNVTLTIDRTNHYEDKDFNVNALVGRGNQKEESKDNVVENVKINYVKCGLVKDSDGNFLVTDLSAFMEFRDSVNDGTTYQNQTVKLVSDIDLQGVEWTPIGSATNKFGGNFDGNGHKISNLKVDVTGVNAGLFGNVGIGGGDGAKRTIGNFTLENATVSGDLYVGVVAGIVFPGILKNITVTGDVKVNNECKGSGWTGVVVGSLQSGYIENCHVEVSKNSYVKSQTNNAGGVVGFIDYPSPSSNAIKGCTSNIDVTATSCVGGILGATGGGATSLEVTNCSASGTLTITSSVNGFVGGIVGRAMSNTTLDECHFEGTLVRKELTNYTLKNYGLLDYGTGTTTIKSSTSKVNLANGFVCNFELDQNKNVTRYFEVSTAEGLVALSEATNKGYVTKSEGSNVMNVKLTKDIDMKNVEEFMPISGQWMNFDGQNHTISNLNCGMDKNGKSGFVGYGGSCVVENLTLENVSAKGSQAGAFIAHSFEGATIRNCTLKGVVNITYEKTSEEWFGIGVFTGISGVNATYENLTIQAGCKVTLSTIGMEESKCPEKSTNLLLGMIATGAEQPKLTVTNDGEIVVLE